MKLSYKLTGQGWASAVIADGERRFEIERISYLSEGLGNLLKAAIGPLEGAERDWFLWNGEPEEHRWIINRTGDSLLIRILWFGDAFKALPDDEGKEVFQCRCGLENFADEVLGCARNLLAEHTAEGYLDEWGYEFPEEEFGKLEWLLNERHKRNGTAKQGTAAKA